VPLLVSVLGGNAVTATAVLACLDTVDATALRRLHPAVAAHVAAMPWADTTTGVRDVVRWRAALPAAVGYRYKPRNFETLPDIDTLRTALHGVTAVDLRNSNDVTDAVVAALPPMLRRVNVAFCQCLTQRVSFTHLPALESLDCTSTIATLAILPPTLGELVCAPQCKNDFGHLRSLQVLRCYGLSGAKTIATLPPSLEELDVSRGEREWPPDWSAAHLTRLRVLRASGSGIHDAALATLPPSLQVLDLQDCKQFKQSASFSHLRCLHTLNLRQSGVHNRMLTTLPPSLVSLNLERAGNVAYGRLTHKVVFPHLPALRMLNVSYTSVGDAAVASLPAGLEELCMVDCANATQRASLGHLTALRVLQSSGTDLPRTTMEACRARGCYAPADGFLRPKPTSGHVTSVALLSGTRVVSCTTYGCVSLWDASRGGDAVANLEICDNRTHCDVLVVLADGHRVAIGTTRSCIGKGDGTGIIVWDTHNTTARSFIDCGVGVCELAVLHNGNLLAGCIGGPLRVVDADAGAVVATLEGHSHAETVSCCGNVVHALVVLPDGRAASTAEDNKVWVWDVNKQVRVDTLLGHTSIVTTLVALPDGRLASGSWDETVRLWDMRGRRGACISVFAWLGDTVRALAALPDGRLASASWEGKLMVWDTRDATRVPSPSPVVVNLESVGNSTLVPLPGSRLATGGNGVRLWQMPPEALYW